MSRKGRPLFSVVMLAFGQVPIVEKIIPGKTVLPRGRGAAGRGRWPEGGTEALAAHCAARPGRGSAALSDDALTSLSCGVCGSGHQMRHGRRFGRPRGLRTAPVLGPVLQEGGQARSPPSLPAAPATQSRGPCSLLRTCSVRGRLSWALGRCPEGALLVLLS